MEICYIIKSRIEHRLVLVTISLLWPPHYEGVLCYVPRLFIPNSTMILYWKYQNAFLEFPDLAKFRKNKIMDVIEKNYSSYIMYL